MYFRKLTVLDGLNNGNIHSIGKDARGFMWFASLSGLNRFDGYEVKTYNHIPGDSTSIPSTIIRCMASDSNGLFFLGHEEGLLKYDQANDKFIRLTSFRGLWVNDLAVVSKNLVLVSTFNGLYRFDPQTNKAVFLGEKNRVFNRRIYCLELHENKILVGTSKGLLIYDPLRSTVEEINTEPVKNAPVISIAIDANKDIWLAGAGKAFRVLKFSPGFRTFTSFDRFIESGLHTIYNLAAMEHDSRGRIWIATQKDGIFLYDPKVDSIQRFVHNSQKVWTISTNLHSCIYAEKDGKVWIGGNNGINYIDADNNFFNIIPVFDKDPDILNRRVARVVTEDRTGKLWFGTIDGIVCYNPRNFSYKEWNNREGKPPQLHYNSVRGIQCDVSNNIWIATGGGINKYDQGKNKMHFYKWADSIPLAFYFSADKDRDGNLWFGCRDFDGFYYYMPSKDSFFSIRKHPLLKVFAGNGGRKFFQDSKGRYWIGFNGTGLGMYDPRTSKKYHWTSSAGNAESISGNIILDITEDKTGVVWISSFNGLSSIDPQLRIKNYNQSNGLINNSISSLSVDDMNRLWIGTGAGLMLFDSSRANFLAFGMEHGLPSIEFPEHAAHRMNNKDIMMATQNGFIRFSPLDFKDENRKFSLYFNYVTVSGKEKQPLFSNKLSLSAKDNFFTIGFAAINFENAKGTWYAYKLEGIDEEWKYTQNRFADYTNIPGGDYTFKVKASTSRSIWPGEASELYIHIDTPFYKTWWFRLLILAAVVLSVYAIYHSRVRERRRMLDLKNKAQLLEKEKVVVLYENLKQQLNPHFLFNSLTSLSGLIETDPKLAGNFLDQMSKIYRYILLNRDRELVSLKEELNFVKVYFNLQKTRFRQGLQINMDVDPEQLHKSITPVTVQNLVENAIKHNIIDIDSPLVIEIFTETDYLIVRNNLQKKNMVETSNKQGLAGLKSLYHYLTPKPIVIEETEKYFVIKIPLI